MGLLRVCLILLLPCAAFSAKADAPSPGRDKKAMEEKIRKLEKEKWMKPMLKSKKMQA